MSDERFTSPMIDFAQPQRLGRLLIEWVAGLACFARPDTGDIDTMTKLQLVSPTGTATILLDDQRRVTGLRVGGGYWDVSTSEGDFGVLQLAVHDRIATLEAERAPAATAA